MTNSNSALATSAQRYAALYTREAQFSLELAQDAPTPFANLMHRQDAWKLQQLAAQHAARARRLQGIES